MLVSVHACVGVKVLREWGVLDVNSELTIGEVFHGISTGQVESPDRFHLPEQYADSLYFLLKKYRYRLSCRSVSTQGQEV